MGLFSGSDGTQEPTVLRRHTEARLTQHPRPAANAETARLMLERGFFVVGIGTLDVWSVRADWNEGELLAA